MEQPSTLHLFDDLVAGVAQLVARNHLERPLSDQEIEAIITLTRNAVPSVLATPRPKTQEKSFYTPGEVATLLRVSRGKVMTWIRNGELKASNLASHDSRMPRYRINSQAIKDLQEVHAVQPLPTRTRRAKRQVDEGQIEFF